MYLAEMHSDLQLAPQIITVNVLPAKLHQIRTSDVRPVGDVVPVQTIISQSHVRRARAHAINVAVVIAAARQTFGAIGGRIRALDARYAEHSVQQGTIYISIHCEQE